MTILKWGAEQLVNTTTFSDQDVPTVTALLDGGYVIVWHDRSLLGGDSSGSSVKMQRYDAFGNKAGGETLVNTTTTGDQRDSRVTTLADGSFVVCWTDESGAGGNGDDVRFRRFEADGTPINLTNVVAAGAADDQSVPDVVALPGGGFVISYQDEQSGSFDIFARRFDEFGVPAGGLIPVISTADGEVNPTIAAFEDDSFVVAWTNITTGQIFFQRFNENGTPNGAAVPVNNVIGGVVFFSDVVVLENGGFLVAWEDGGQPFPDTDERAIRAQLYNASGAAVGAEFTVNTLAGLSQDDVDLVALPGGGFAAVYESAREIRGQIFDGLGRRVGEEFLVNTSTTNDQGSASVDVLSDGRLIVTWEDESSLGDDTSSKAVRMQIIDPRDGIVTGTASAETLLGHDRLNDQISGLAGADTLNGLAGADDMYGGDGDDTYVVDNPGDRAIEIFGRGTDTVLASVTFPLGANVENLTLTGPAPISGIGNALANVITGNASANVLSGLLGADTLNGGFGDDTYNLDDGADVVIDAGGVDTITSRITRTLTSFPAIENLTLLGALAVNGIGNNLANIISGNDAANTLSGGSGADTLRGFAGSDVLVGGFGRDTLTGGANADFFVFNAGLSAANRDTITDFNHAADTFRLENAVMRALGGAGALKAGFFHLGAAAADGNDHIIYNRASGALFYDSNGFGAGGVTQLATLTNHAALQANDFKVI